MPISPHQVNNVLRVYGDQLCQTRISKPSAGNDAGEPQRIGVSAKTRREAIIDAIAENIIKRITQSESHDNASAASIENLENEHGKPASSHKNLRSGLIFKEIDGNAETVSSLSLEDSKFLTQKMSIITRKT